MKETFFFQTKTDDETTKAEKEKYQGMTSSIIFSMVKTRPNIAFATLVASCFAKNLGNQHTEIVKMILQYL